MISGGSDILDALLAQSWQVGLLIVGVALVTRFFCRRRPHLACALWMLVILKCVTPPFWSSPAGLFSWALAKPVVIDRAGVQPPAETPVADEPGPTAEVIRSVELTAPTAPDPSPTPDTPDAPNAARASIGWQAILASCWAVGAAVLWVIACWRWVLCWRAISRQAVPTPAPVEAAFGEVARQLGINRRVRLVVTGAPISPAATGLIRPAVVLPQVVLAGISPERLRPILAHELIHVRRGDVYFGLLQSLAGALLWFHPLVWWANHRASETVERCCDEEVVGGLCGKPVDYARCLLDVLELTRDSLWPDAVPALPGVRPRAVTRQRLETIMRHANESLGFQRRAPFWCWMVLLTMAALVLPGRGLVLGETGSGAGSGSQSGTLQYQFQPGQTVWYEVRIELGDGQNKEVRSGMLCYTAKTATAQGFTLEPSGGLAVTHPNAAPQTGFRPGFHHFGIFHHPTTSDAEPMHEVSFDQFGQITRASATSRKGLMIGDLATLVVEPLSPEGKDSWEIHTDVSLTITEPSADHAGAPGSPGAFGPRGATGQDQPTETKFSSHETARYHLGKKAEGTVVIEKQYNLQTDRMVGADPYLRAAADGRTVLNLKDGLAQEGEFGGAIVAHQNSGTVRVPFRQTFRRLSAQEQAKAEAQAAKQAEVAKANQAVSTASVDRLHRVEALPVSMREPLSAADLAKALADLKSPDVKVRGDAVEKLASAKPVPDQARRVVAALSDVKPDAADPFLWHAAQKGKDTWAEGTAAGGADLHKPTPAERAKISAMVRDLKSNRDINQRKILVGALGQYDDKAAAEAVAGALSDAFTRPVASQTLKLMGAIAAPAVAKQVDRGDHFTKMEALEVLKEIGTTNELPVLRIAAHDSDVFIQKGATDAILAIEDRVPPATAPAE